MATFFLAIYCGKSHLDFEAFLFFGLVLTLRNWEKGLGGLCKGLGLNF